LRDLETIEKQGRLRIATRLKEYAKNPLKYSQKLTDPRMGTYRFRIGDYRVIFDMAKEDIVVLRVGHRKSIYR
jgi:mRNA interferase RelE/StbE